MVVDAVDVEEEVTEAEEWGWWLRGNERMMVFDILSNGLGE
jgi:hypothetical protein